MSNKGNASYITCNNIVDAVMTDINKSSSDGTKPPDVVYIRDYFTQLITGFSFTWYSY